MTPSNASAAEIARACEDLSRLGPFPSALALGLTAGDGKAMCEAVFHLIDANRTEGVRDVIERFRPTQNLGDFALLQSSRLHRLKGDFAAALADLDEVFARFPQKETVHWWAGRARCLASLNRPEDAEATAREGASRFPQNPVLATLAAQMLARQARWPEALAAWNDVFARFAERLDGEMYAGRAQALLRLGHVEAAQAGLDAMPDDAAVWRERASLAELTGDDARLRASLEALTGRFAATSRAERWAELARLRHDARDYEGGAAALAELERRFPDSPLGERERLRLAEALERGQDELTALTQAALARFPTDPALRGQGVLTLLAQGRLEEAERVVTGLEAEGAQGVALIARLRLEADRGGNAHLRAWVERFAAGRTWTFWETLTVADFLLNQRAPWGIAFADELIAGLGPRATETVKASVLGAQIKIARREDEAACRLIDAIPAAYKRPEVDELRAWAANKRGALGEAQALWRGVLHKDYFGAVHSSVGPLERLSRDISPPREGVTAFVVFRNEAPQLPAFLAHHRKLGVRRFVFIDHLSSDESCALLLKEPDVVLYQSRDSYQLSSSGRRWIAEIVAREGAKGWGLQLDVDECFVYPGWETTPLDRLLSYLDARGFTGLRAFMLDMFARHLIGDDGEPAPLSEHRYYDDDHIWIGHVRPPYLSPVGGVRTRLFGAVEYLHKVPLWRLDAGQILGSHETTPLALADVSGALLHYKLYNMALRGRDLSPGDGLGYLEPDADLWVLRRHSRYAARLSHLWRTDLFDPRVSRELTDSLDLTRRGLMTASADYLEWSRG